MQAKSFKKNFGTVFYFKNFNLFSSFVLRQNLDLHLMKVTDTKKSTKMLRTPSYKIFLIYFIIGTQV